MPKKGSKPQLPSDVGGDELSVLNRAVRLLEILTQLSLKTAKGERSQSEMISLLDTFGCGQTEIARLLGTTQNTVNVALYKAKRRQTKKKRK